MKGLLVKDMMLIKKQGKFLILVTVIAVAQALIGDGISGFTPFITMITTMCALLSVTTISYDDYNKGNSYLFTLPFERKTYAKEKYVFGFCIGMIGLLLSSLFAAGYAWAFIPGFTMEMLVVPVVTCIAVPIVLLAVMIPLFIKFGSEKSRYAMFAIFGVVAILGFAGSKVVEALNIRLDFSFLETMSVYLLALIALFALFCLVFISYQLSKKILLRKEF